MIGSRLAGGGKEETGRAEGSCKGHEKPFGGGGYVYYLDCSDEVMNVYISQNFRGDFTTASFVTLNKLFNLL